MIDSGQVRLRRGPGCGPAGEAAGAPAGGGVCPSLEPAVKTL